MISFNFHKGFNNSTSSISSDFLGHTQSTSTRSSSRSGRSHTITSLVDSSGRRSSKNVSSSLSNSLSFDFSVSALSIVKILFLVMLFASFTMIIASGNGFQYKTLAGTLEYFKKSQFIDLTWIKEQGILQIVGDWGAFNFLKNFFNYIGLALKSSIIMGAGVINGISGIVFILGYFLGF